MASPRRGRKADARHLESLGQLVLCWWEGGKWSLRVDEGGPELRPLVWSDSTHSRVVGYAVSIAKKYRIEDDDRKDFVQECLLKAYRQTSKGKIRKVSAYMTLCNFKALDFLRKRKRRNEWETEEIETPDGFVCGSCETETPLSATVETEFPELVEVARTLVAGYDLGEVAKMYGRELEEMKEWLESEQARARETFGV